MHPRMAGPKYERSSYESGVEDIWRTWAAVLHEYEMYSHESGEEEHDPFTPGRFWKAPQLGAAHDRTSRLILPRYAHGANDEFTSTEPPEAIEALLEGITRRMRSEMKSAYEGRIAELEKRLETLQKEDRPQHADLWQQSKAATKTLESIFGIGRGKAADTGKLDGLLSDCVDAGEDSRDLVRSIRGG